MTPDLINSGNSSQITRKININWGQLKGVPSRSRQTRRGDQVFWGGENVPVTMGDSGEGPNGPPRGPSFSLTTPGSSVHLGEILGTHITGQHVEARTLGRMVCSPWPQSPWAAQLCTQRGLGRGVLVETGVYNPGPRSGPCGASLGGDWKPGRGGDGEPSWPWEGRGF